MSDAPVFVVEDGLVEWHETEWRLTRQEAQLFGLIAAHRPRMMHTERIATLMWPAQLPSEPLNHISVVVCRLRRKLAGLPLAIESRQGFGYRLVGEIEIHNPEGD